MAHPQAPRSALRQPPQGGAPSGLAKPVPRVLPHGLLRGQLSDPMEV